MAHKNQEKYESPQLSQKRAQQLNYLKREGPGGSEHEPEQRMDKLN